MSETASGKAEVTIEAVITRADGTKENLGVVSKQQVENPSLLKRLFTPKRYGNSTNKRR
jgi:hypothetical protein